MTAVVVCAVVVVFYAVVYRHVVGRFGALARRVAQAASLTERHSEKDVDDALKLAGAALAQLVLAVVLWLLVGPSAGPLVSGWSPALLALAALLGIGSLGLSAVLVRAVVGVTRGSAETWLASGGGGWVRQFRAVGRVASPGVAVVTVVAYVAGEEVVFRVVLLHVLEGWGPAVAVTVATALFVGVQAVGMPSLSAAFFPMVGAAVVGAVHGLLYLAVPALVPLVVAHAVFLLGATAPRVPAPTGAVR
ncbi:CPBP family intramembrane glutamic endopeptidase [Georgenia sp. Marseille-Q6866]